MLAPKNLRLKPTAAHPRREPVRFDSFRFRTFRKLIGSVQFSSDKNNCPGSMRFGLRFSDASSLGPVQFVLLPRPAPAGSRNKRFASVRPVRFASVRPVRFGSVSYIYIYIYIYMYVCMYVYIYIYREREILCVYIYIYTHMYILLLPAAQVLGPWAPASPHRGLKG